MEILMFFSQLGGGLVLFLFSIGMLSNTLKKVSGGRLKSILKKATDNPVKGACMGTMATFFVQSSSVTVLLLLGLVNAGIMNLRQAIYVILGTEIGTTITAQIVAFKVKTIFYPLMIVGFAMGLLCKREKLRHTGDILLFLGLIFLAMKIMADGSRPLRDFPPVVDIMANFGVYPLWGILIGAILTAITSSSSATTSLVIAMGMEGLIGLQSGIALIIGANIGTCVLELIATIGTNTAAKRTGMAQFVINLIGALLFYPFLDQFSRLIALTASDLPRLIANAHSIFNLTVSLVLMPFVGGLIYLLEVLVPDRGKPVKTSFGILEDKFLEVPALALYEVEQEVNRMATIVGAQLGLAGRVFFDNDKNADRLLRENEQTVDSIHEKVGDYIHRISSLMLNERERAKKRALVHAVTDLERIADLAENIADCGKDTKNVFSDKARGALELFFAKADLILATAVNSLKIKGTNLHRDIHQVEHQLDELKAEFENRYLPGGQGDGVLPVVDAKYPDILNDLERIATHANNIIEHTMKMN